MRRERKDIIFLNFREFYEQADSKVGGMVDFGSSSLNLCLDTDYKILVYYR